MSDASILEKVTAGGRITTGDALVLLGSDDLGSLAKAADSVRRRFHPDNQVSFLIDRNIECDWLIWEYMRYTLVLPEKIMRHICDRLSDASSGEP